MSLQACLNGARDPSVPRLPVTPATMARDGAAVAAAGASSLHLHPRDARARESLAPGDVAACLGALRAACDLPLGLSTGEWIAPGGAARLAALQAWADHPGARPDFVSVNLAEPDAPEVIALMRAQGIGLEYGLTSSADVQRLFSLEDAGLAPGSGGLRLLIEMDARQSPEAFAEARTLHRVLCRALPHLPILLHGYEDSAWDYVALARDLGCQARIGLEDRLTLPDGSQAGNGALLRAARAILQQRPA